MFCKTLKKIVVIRHAQSQEDINPNLNGELEDYQISITKEGKHQIDNIIDKIQIILSPFESVKVYSSPSNRALQTTSVICSQLDLDKSITTVEPRIRNLNWGNTTSINVKEIERERYKKGVLYYQFPGGDDSSIFIKNIGNFVNELLTVGKQKDFSNSVVIITHGFALRIIAKFLLKMSDDDFRWIKNPPNCYIANFQIDNFRNITIDKPLSCRSPF